MFLVSFIIIDSRFQMEDYSQEEESWNYFKNCMTIIKTFILWFFEVRD